jgi:lysosomal acid lipase/cholesteryl ester hydrolase
LALNPSLKDKVNICIGLSPVITPKGLKNETVAALIRSSPDLIYLLFGRRSLFSSIPYWLSILSRETWASIIDLSLRLLFEWDCDYLVNRHIVYRHLYSYSSVKLVSHWFQIIQTGRLAMYDEMQNQTYARYSETKLIMIASLNTQQK